MFCIRKCLFTAGFVLILCTLFFGQAQCQAFKKPEVLPASPDVSNLTKFDHYPVNLFTGVPDISIPLYTIRVQDIEVPIVLRYHASGIKVIEDAGKVGLGWSLSAGAMITRKIMGNFQDEFSSDGYLNEGSLAAHAQYVDPLGHLQPCDPKVNPDTIIGVDYLWLIHDGKKDVEPDIFSYSLLNKSGKFFFDQKDAFKAKVIPYDPIAISYSLNRPKPNNTEIDSFYILDDKGVEYKFGTHETTSGMTRASRSAWLVDEIFTADKQDKISFKYTENYEKIYHDLIDYIVVEDKASGIALPNPGTAYTKAEDISATVQHIDEITFPGGKVEFEMSDDDRLDGYTGQKRLVNIKIYNIDEITGLPQLIKTITLLNQTYFETNDGSQGRMKLDGIEIKSSDNLPVERYRFEYNTQQLLPSKASKARDYWGYFNNKNNNSLVPQKEIDYYSNLTSGNTPITIGSNVENGREVDPKFNQACILRRIFFPTGGYIDFDYETNRYMENNGDVKFAGGLRLKRTKLFDGSSTTPLVKTYTYGADGRGIGQKNFVLSNYFFEEAKQERCFSIQVSNCWQVGGERRSRTFYSESTLELEPYDGSPVMYPVVTEFYGDLTTNNGKIVYAFKAPTDQITQPPMFGRMVTLSKHFWRGLLEEKHVFRNENGIYKPVSSTINDYEAFPNTKYDNAGLLVNRFLLSHMYSFGQDYKLGAATDIGNLCHDMNDSRSYSLVNYDIISGDTKLIKTTEQIFDRNDPTKFYTTTTTYNFSNFNHQQVTSTTSTLSNGKQKSHLYRYPHDFGDVVYSSMIQPDKHMISQLIEEEEQLDGVKLTLQKNVYTDLGNNVIKPVQILSQIRANPLEVEASLGYTSEGKLNSIIGKDGISKSYIWGYNRVYPIAQATNAAPGQIAYTGFEEAGQGGWTYTSVIASATAKAGKYEFTGSVSNRDPLQTASGYWLTVWVNGATAPSVTAASAPKTGQLVESAGAWNLYQYDLGNTTNVTLTTGANPIDELRLFPYESQMSSYVYEPLIGMKTTLDANNVASNYSYDLFGRLSTKMDRNGNIVNAYNYYYKTGTDVIAPLQYDYWNNAISRDYQRQNCPNNYRGTYITYKVAAGDYSSEVSQSDANGKAIWEADHNGPIEANENGECILIEYTDVTVSNIIGATNYKVRFEPKFSEGTPILMDIPSQSNSSLSFRVVTGEYTVSIFTQTPGTRYNFDFYGNHVEDQISFALYDVTIPTGSITLKVWK